MGSKILLLEDDKLFNETIEDFLDEEGFTVDTAYNPKDALDLTYTNNYSLYLFDVNLPYQNGFDFLSMLRESGDLTPTIFITSRTDKSSLVEGFNKGGDDYITKPVDLDELLLRIKAVLKREMREHTIKIEDYTFDSISKVLYKNGVNLNIGIKSSHLLSILLEFRGKVVPIDTINQQLWSPSEDISVGALRVYITKLKKYFPTQISNIRGVGYKMDI